MKFKVPPIWQAYAALTTMFYSAWVIEAQIPEEVIGAVYFIVGLAILFGWPILVVIFTFVLIFVINRFQKDIDGLSPAVPSLFLALTVAYFVIHGLPSPYLAVFFLILAAYQYRYATQEAEDDEELKKF